MQRLCDVTTLFRIEGGGGMSDKVVHGPGKVRSGAQVRDIR